MRTIPFRSVFDEVVRLLGRDPQGEIKPDMARAIVDRINDRVRTICQLWRWPQWEITEERAFRTIWNDSHQFSQGDELFYIPDMTYYTATGDPPIGVAPPDPNYFEVLDPVDTFIAYDQVCRRAIGMVLGVYKKSPRIPTGSKCGGLRFEPSERGVDVLSTGGPTVFVTYKMPVPRYTIVPWVAKTYVRANMVFDPGTGECFQALDTTNTLVSDSAHWRWIPFPEEWDSWVSNGAFADCLTEYDADPSDAQVKLVLSQNAEQKARDAFQQEVDSLIIQGQKLQYNFCVQKMGCVCESQPWSGNGSATTLSDECQDELGWTYPAVPQAAAASLKLLPDIVSLTGPEQPALNAVPTGAMALNSVRVVVIIVSGSRQSQEYQLRVGAADPADAGQVAPLDFDSAHNNVFWGRTA